MNARRLGLGVLATMGAVVVAASTAWACVSGPVVNLSTIQAKPGEQITLNGTGFRQPDPVLVRFNALDGPILATLDKPSSDRTVSGQITVPAAAAPGNYVLVVTQQGADGELTQSPIRALLTVVGPSGQTPVVGADLAAADNVDRQPALVRADNSVSSGTLALVALGVAGMGMFIAGMAALFASRRGATARPVPVARS